MLVSRINGLARVCAGAFVVAFLIAGCGSSPVRVETQTTKQTKGMTNGAGIGIGRVRLRRDRGVTQHAHPGLPPSMTTTTTFVASWSAGGAALRAAVAYADGAHFQVRTISGVHGPSPVAPATSTARKGVGVPSQVAPAPVIGTAITAGPTTTGDYHAWPDWPLWRCIGQHEQGGSGRYDTYGDGIAWGGSPAGGLPGSGYPGGLGIMRQAWDERRDASMPTNGAYATPAQQIIVARRIKERFGLHAWATAGICG